jgi:hypothetical protein
MEINTIGIIVAIAVSAITGAIASLVAPWANWGVEKRKNKLRWRKGFIDTCKRIISKNRFNPNIFRETPYYSNLRPHLSVRLQKEIKEERYTPGKRMDLKEKLEVAMKASQVKQKLLEEINLLEVKWGLI